MNQNEKLQQSLLELHYGLLDDQEARSLRAKIETDPEVAMLWAETLSMAGQFASAAKLAGSPGVEEVESRLQQPAQQPVQPHRNRVADAELIGSAERAFAKKPEKDIDRFKRRRRTYRILMSTLAASAACVAGVIVSLYVATMPSQPGPSLQIVAESTNRESENEFAIFTRELSRSVGSATGVPTSLSLAIMVGDVVLHRAELNTNDSGRAEFKVPPELVLPKNAALKVTSANATLLSIPLQPTRCLTYLTTDKPVYRPGETIRYRSLTLDRQTTQPTVDLPIRFELINPSGSVVTGSANEGVTDRGVGNGEIDVPEAAPGGTYVLKVKSLDGFFPEETTKIQVRNYRAPRFKKDLEFKKRSYGPGDKVEADFIAIRAEGGPVANQSVTISAKVDGEEVHRQQDVTDSAGGCLISFNLPEHISKGVGQLSVVVDDGGTQEVQSRTIPIQIGKVEVDFYPEGGYLVHGLNNRVYFSARNPLGKPIHIEGEILDDAGKRVGRIKTVRDGMGRFEFAPKMGQRYSLKVTAPAAINNSPRLPQVVESLPVLSTGKGVFANSEPIVVDVQSANAQPVVVRATCRGALVANVNLNLKAGKSRVEIPLPATVEGVVRVTILDPAAPRENVAMGAALAFDRPLVERLVYRECKRKLTVKLDGPESGVQRSPGEPVIVNLQVTDENGEPAPAVLGVAVIDDAALSLREDELPGLRTHFVLTSEIEKPEDLEHADFYLSGTDESRESLDLLLGTQGWRRFVGAGSAQPGDGLAFNEQVSRLLELNGVADKRTSVASVDPTDQAWRNYSNRAHLNWSRMMIGMRWLVLPFLILMLIVFLMRPRMKLASHLGMWLAVLLGAGLILGCGAEMDSGRALTSEPAMEAPMPEAMEGFAENGEPEPETVRGFVFRADAEFLNRPRAIDAVKMFRQRGEQDGRGQMGEVDGDLAAKRAIGMGMGAMNGMGLGMGPGGMGGDRGPGMNLDLEGQRFVNPQALEEMLRARGMNADSVARQLLDSLRFPVREYAHQHVSTKENVREDFAETLFWQPLMITDSTGKAEIRFELSDSVTTFRVMVDAHSNGGRIGSGGGEVVSRLPLQIEPKMPLAVTDGDRIDLPVAIINATDNEIPLNLKIETGNAFKLVGPESQDLTLKNKQRTRNYFGLEVVSAAHDAATNIELTGVSVKDRGHKSTPDFSDSITKSILVSPSGYPIRESVSGVLDEKVTVVLPDSSAAVPGSLAISLQAYPSPLADLMSGVESILREPHGCFEQTSATNYPNAMVLQYLNSSKLSKPETTRKAKSMLERGYNKLISFECSKLGYEWFGTDPGHEALSAFGLMQFADMAKIMDVDAEMMVRTREWLIKRRDGKGNFIRNPRHLHVWSVNQDIVDAYILWALTEADVASGNPQRAASELSLELKELNRVAQASEDPYLMSLAAATMMNVENASAGEALLNKLASMQKKSGVLVGETTVTQSGGISLKVETTAMAVLAWAKDSGKYQGEMKSAVKWLASNRQGSGGFGSTQATVLALKALVAYAETATTSVGSSVLYVKQNGKVVGQVKVPEDAKAGSTLEINDLGSKIDPSVNELELVADGINNLPFSIEVVYHTPTPPTDDRCPFEVETKFAGVDGQASMESGDTIQVEAVMKNKTAEGQPMALMTIGLPSGVEPRADQLDELKEAGVFDFYEVRPREVTCYWRTIAPNEEKKVAFDVTAEIPGKYTGPASRAYLYYTAEQKTWASPLKVEIGK